MKILPSLQIFTLCLLISGAGLLFIPSLEPDAFEYPKAMFFILTTAILSILNLIHWGLNNKKISIKKIPIPIKLIGFIFIAELLAFIFSQDHSISLTGAPYRLQGFIAELTIIISLLNTTYVFANTRPKKHLIFFTWLIIITIISSVISLLPYIIEIPFFNIWDFYNRAFGIFGNPNYLAVFLISSIPFFGLILNNKSRLIKIFSLAGLIITLSSLFLTGCRSAWIALIVSLLITGLIIAIQKKRYKLLLLAITTIFITICVFTFQQFQNTPSLSRLSLTKNNLGSLTTRLYLQKSGLQLFKEHPLIGSGQDTIAGRIEPYLPEYLKSNDVFYIDRTHNEFLDILIMQGLLGFIAYITFWIYLFIETIKSSIHSNNLTATLSTIAIISIHIYYTGNFTTISSNILLYTLASYLIIANLQANKETFC
jgi:O-antigen ligase